MIRGGWEREGGEKGGGREGDREGEKERMEERGGEASDDVYSTAMNTTISCMTRMNSCDDQPSCLFAHPSLSQGS